MRFVRPCLTALAALGIGALAGCNSQSDNMLTGHPSLATAQVALASGSPDLALNICSGLLVGKSGDPWLLACKGDALTALGRNAEAMSVFESILVFDPSSAPAKIGLGRLTLAVNPGRAEQLFLDALTSNPRDPVALNNLGIARDLQGRHGPAQAAYAEAIAASPGMRAAQVNLALSLAMVGRGQEAVRIMRPIGERADATPRERHDLAAVLAMDGKSDEAAKLLRTDMNSSQVDEALTGFQALPTR